MTEQLQNHRRLQAAADRFVPAVSLVVLRAASAARDEVPTEALEAALARGDLGAALSALEPAFDAFSGALSGPEATSKAHGAPKATDLPDLTLRTMQAGAAAAQVCALGKPPIRQPVTVVGKLDEARKRLTILEAESQILDARARFDALKNWQLNKLKLVNNDTIRTPAGAKAVGLYQNEGSKITVAARRPMFHDPTPMVGGFVTDKGVAGTIRHELGHHVHMRVFGGNVAMQDEWIGIADQYTAVDAIRRDRLSGNSMWVAKPAPAATPISTYAKTNDMELFAESWTLYAHPDYRQPGFPRLPGNIEAFLDKWLKPKPNAWTPQP